MRSLVVLLALCLSVVMAMPPSKRGEWRREGGRRDGRRGGPIMCSLLNQTSNSASTIECREGSQCDIDVTVEFQITAFSFAASFCKSSVEEEPQEPEQPQDPELLEGTEEESVDDELIDLSKAVLRSACSIATDGTNEITPNVKCRGDESCNLGPVGIQIGEDFYTASYCQDLNDDDDDEDDDEDDDDEEDEDEDEEVDWLKVFNGKCKKGHRSGKDSAERQPRGELCQITSADGAIIETEACQGDATCSVGPVPAKYNDVDVNVFFCERPASSEDEEEDDEEKDLEGFARKMFCNACELKEDGEDTQRKLATCAADEECSAAITLSADIDASTVVGKFCASTSAEAQTSLLEATKCDRTSRKRWRSKFQRRPSAGSFNRRAGNNRRGRFSR